METHGKSPRLNIALIGAGGVGKRHLQCIEAMEAAGRARLAAVVDPAAETLRHALPELHHRGVRWYADYREMLEAETGLQAVSIATPIPLHFEMTSRCLERNLHVLLEKPPVPLIQQLNELVARDRQRRVAVAFQWICSREVQRLKRMIVGGRLGEIRDIRMSACWPRRDAYYARAGWAGRMILDGQPVYDGPATNGLAHLIHSAMFFLGEGAEDFGKPKAMEAELYRARSIEGYDLICFRGESASNIPFLGSLAHASEQYRPFRIEVRGSRGWARIDGDGTRLETDQGPVSFGPETPSDPFLALYENFLDFAGGRIPRPASTLEDARGYVLTTNGALLSSGRIHPIPAPWARKYVLDGEPGWTVDGIAELMERGFQEGKMFSEMDVPWRAAGRRISVEALTRVSLEDYLK